VYHVTTEASEEMGADYNGQLVKKKMMYLVIIADLGCTGSDGT
jgi:hypothetical protein